MLPFSKVMFREGLGRGSFHNCRWLGKLHDRHEVTELSATTLGLRKALSVKKRMTVSDWNILRELYDSKSFAHLAICALRNSGKSLNDLNTFIESYENHSKVPLVLKCLTLPVYRKFSQDCSKDDVKKVLSICKEVLAEYPILTEEMIECLIQGLTLTSTWKKSGLELLERLNNLKNVPGEAYSHFISGAFYRNNPTIGWKFMQEVFSRGGYISSEVYHSIMDYYENKSSPPKTEDVMKIIEFFERTSVMPSEDFAMRVGTFFQENTRTWVARMSSVNASGVCSCCSSKLQKLCPTAKEMEKLAESIFTDVLQRNNEFINSSPEEIIRFKKFLNNCSNYDIVLDGLNVAALKKDPRRRYSQLINTINHLNRMRFSVLVIGRKHMLKWADTNTYPKIAQYFFAEDQSKDDPFALYAAIQNGPGTYFVSNDFMGLHFSKINQAMQGIFRKWQFSSQVLSDVNHKMIFPAYSPVCQTSSDGHIIHIPFSTSRIMFSPSGWLCLQQVSAEAKERADFLWPKSQKVSETSAHCSTYRTFALKVIDETSEKRLKRHFS